MTVINKLGIKREQINQKIIEIFEEKVKEERNKLKEERVDVLNIVVANNAMILKVWILD